MIYNDRRTTRHADMHKVPRHHTLLSQNVDKNGAHNLKQTETWGRYKVMNWKGKADRRDK